MYPRTDKVYGVFRETVAAYRMIEEGDEIAVGVSGGADSVCLLFLLARLQKEQPFSLKVVHVNHGLRAEAKDDAAYVETLCKELGISFFYVEKDVETLSKKWKLSAEEAGRRVRLEAFFACAKKTALAHHADDRAETLLYRLFRGTGVIGAAGIRPVQELSLPRKSTEQDDKEEAWRNDAIDAANTLEAPRKGVLLRPLLYLTRAELTAYLRERGIAYREDATNRENVYARNKIRNLLLPQAREINAQAVRHLAEAAEEFAEVSAYMQEQARAAAHRCARPVPDKINISEEKGESGTPDDGFSESAGSKGKRTVSGFAVDIEKFLAEPRALRGFILRELLSELSPSMRDITAAHIRAVSDLFSAQSGKSVRLPYGLTARRDFGEITLKEIGADELSASGKAEAEKDSPLSLRVYPVGDAPFTWENVPEKRYTKFFDYDTIKKPPVLRTRRSGDFFWVKTQGGAHKKSLKKYMIEAKLPAAERDALPLLADDSHILWAVGLRISEACKLTAETKTVLEAVWRNA